jgi:hypothetical protein
LSRANGLETAALEAIAARHPADEAVLLRQFHCATITKRKNSGAGFFVDLSIDRTKAGPVSLASPIGPVWAAVNGLVNPLGFLLFLRDAYAVLLEAFAVEESTATLDFDRISFAMSSDDQINRSRPE